MEFFLNPPSSLPLWAAVNAKEKEIGLFMGIFEGKRFELIFRFYSLHQGSCSKYECPKIIAAIILPFLKPNADPTLPVLNRPIALTSVLGKLFRKILNKRLFWYLESNNHLSPSQYSFRKGRSTTHALADLLT